MYDSSLQFWIRAIRAGARTSKRRARALRYAISPNRPGDLVLVDGFPVYRLSRRKVAEVLQASGVCVTRGKNAGRALGPQGVENLVVDALARGAVAVLRSKLPVDTDLSFAIRQAKQLVRRAMREKSKSGRRPDRHRYVALSRPVVEGIADLTGWPGQEFDLAGMF